MVSPQKARERLDGIIIAFHFFAILPDLVSLIVINDIDAKIIFPWDSGSSGSSNPRWQEMSFHFFRQLVVGEREEEKTLSGITGFSSYQQNASIIGNQRLNVRLFPTRCSWRGWPNGNHADSRVWLHCALT